MTDEERKAAFAVFLFNSPEDALGAGLAAYPNLDDRGDAMRVAVEWKNDPEVKAKIAELEQNRNSTEGIPTKEDILRKLWEMSREPFSKLGDRVKAAELLTELMGIKKAPDPSSITNNIHVPSEPTYKVVTE